MGPKDQAVVDGLLARVPGLEFCEHDGFAMWIATRPGRLLCKFCYQAAQVLAENVMCAACGQPAGDPDKDAMVVVNVTDWPGAYFYLCTSCTGPGHAPGRTLRLTQPPLRRATPAIGGYH